MSTSPLQKISVVVPVHNARRTLNDCLSALKQQSDSNYEVILVDDCSTDGSAQVCKTSGFKTICLPVNKGQAVARNVGAKESTGQILAFLDSDAVAPLDWLKNYRHLLDKMKEADMICSGYSLNIPDTQPALFAFYESQYRRKDLPLYIRSSTSSNCIVYKKAFWEVKGYPEYYLNSNKDTSTQKAVATNEDAELGFLLVEKGKRIAWSHKNPVRHYFRQTWKGYLNQQIGFARYAVLSVFKFPNLIKNPDIYSSEPMLPQLLVGIIMLTALPIAFLVKYGAILFFIVESCGLIFFYCFHRIFLKFIQSENKGFPLAKSYFWLVFCRLAFPYGVTLGIKDGIFMLINDFRLRNRLMKK